MNITRIIAAAATALTVASPTVAQELKFANFTAPGHTITASVIERLNDELSAATGGKLTVRGYHGGELGAGPAEQYVRVVQGATDIAWGLPGYTSSQFPLTMIAEMPDAIPDGRQGSDAMWDAMDEISGEFPATVPIAVWTSEPNILIMRDAEIRTPADLAGLKIRVAGATAAAVAEAFGASPVQMPINGVYNALQTGLIDGVITGSSTLSDFKLDEVAGSYTIGAPLGRNVFYAVMNQAVYDALDPDARAAIDAAKGRELSRGAETAWNMTAEAALEAARADAGNVVIDLGPEEAAAFAEAVAPVTQAYVDAVGGQAAGDAMRGK